MCTAVAFNKGELYFGRNLDYEIKFGDNVVIAPRGYCFNFHSAGELENHFAIVGMAHVADNFPLYYDGVNEKGLAMAGLNFVGNAYFGEPVNGKTSVAPHEFIPYILGQCENLEKARELLKNMTLVNDAFSKDYPVAQLHWIISDKTGSVTVESTKNGFFVYDNPLGVLTNNPEFPIQMMQINNYMGLSPKQPANSFSNNYQFTHYSRGMGTLGLPGDITSESRFVRAAFIKENSVCDESPIDCVSQVFHVLASVENPAGCCELENGTYQVTQYTCCCDCANGIYYYNYYTNHQLNAIDMRRANLDTSELIVFNSLTKENVNYQN